MTSWVFDIESFAALWFGPAADRMLFPLHYISRFTHMNALELYRAEVREQWSEHGRLDEDAAERLRRAFDVLTGPEVWLEVHGHRQQRPVRAVGARHDRHAAIAEQSTDGARVRVSLVAADQLAHRAVDALPDTEAGKRPRQRFDDHDLRPEAPDVVTIIDGPNPREQYRRLREEPCTSAGVIQVFRGPRTTGGKPPHRVSAIQWHDRHDGRYLETGTRARVVVGANSATLAHHVGVDIGRALEQYRELAEDMAAFLP
ncbi:ESX secretion-associated protein EspG [Nocardia asteroides]|uniref:ESX secretion-associated protein EspG n=1 Tax=Nocardia asteroides TaxID=1824 RepID=UPI001E2C6BF7|nr:ESX secretion-associated protein EspG [Nocardia asteroides]UGT53970.1 ESX secretion-associated protein EspG [Nocardia asteroides]